MYLVYTVSSLNTFRDDLKTVLFRASFDDWPDMTAPIFTNNWHLQPVTFVQCPCNSFNCDSITLNTIHSFIHSFHPSIHSLWLIQENRQYTGVVEPNLSWQRDSWPPELLVKALHCCTHECTLSEDVCRAVSWQVDESVQVNKFLHCANVLLQHCEGQIVMIGYISK